MSIKVVSPGEKLGENFPISFLKIPLKQQGRLVMLNNILKCVKIVQ